MKMKHLASLVTLLALPLGCSESEPAPDRQAAQYESREITTVATVQSYDRNSRKLTLKGPQGNMFTCKVDERVKNADKIKPGDSVAITYTENMAVQVVKKGEGQNDVAILTEQDADADKPKGAVTEQVSLTAEVIAIDKSRGTVTLKGSGGDVRTVAVRHPERLSSIKVGDYLWIRYSEGLAVSVEPAPTEAK